jgi:NAD(P)H-quinone oxidoreductase subunit L
MASILNLLPITAVLYLGLAGAYLLVMPLLVYVYLQKRWYVASSIERLLMYFMVFFFFPGMLLFSPFLNLRPSPRSVQF